MRPLKIIVLLPLSVFVLKTNGQSTTSLLVTRPLQVYQAPVNPDISVPTDSLNVNSRISGDLTYEQTENYLQLTDRPRYNKELARSTVPSAYWNNPDFGFIPPGTSCKDCYEEIQKRNSTSRYFRSETDKGTFYIQQSSGPINFLKNGEWLSIDPRLHKIDSNNYIADQQPIHTSLEISAQRSTIGNENDKIGFNHFTMIEYDAAGSHHAYAANWQNYSVGDNGIYIHDVFPGVDMTIQYSEGTVKSNLLIQHYRDNSSKIVFVDSMDFGPGMNIAFYNGQMEGDKGWNGDLSINDPSAQAQYIYGQIKIFENGKMDSILHGNYSYYENNVELNILPDVYNQTAGIYPIVIDPTVTYGPFNGTANSIGAGLSPAFCSNALVVAVPGQATYTDWSASWSVTNASACGCAGAQRCFMSKDQVYFTSSCGGASPFNAPTNIWGCPAGNCFLGGCDCFNTWAPTIPFGSGETAPATCITPSCLSQNVTFTIFLNKFVCNSANCNSCVYLTNTCAHLNSWSVSLQGHTVEHPNAPTSSTGTVFCAGNCTNLTATGQYGVPPYTYLWNPGGVTTNPYPNVCPTATTTYTCDITDACGNVASNSVTITISGCLPVELLSFTAEEKNAVVNLNWSTATETNSDHFILERSVDGINFSSIAIVPAAGNSNERIDYNYTDEDPPIAVIYYRLKQVDLDGRSTYSKLVSVNISDKSGLYIRPNPVQNLAEIGFNCDQGGETIIKIYNELSEEVYSKKLNCVNGRNSEVIDLAPFTKGIYFIKVIIGDQEFQKRFLKE